MYDAFIPQLRQIEMVNHMPTSALVGILAGTQGLSPMQRATYMTAAVRGSGMNPDFGEHRTSVGGFVNGALSVGIGMVGATLAGKAMNALFSSPPPIRQQLAESGVLAGLLRNR